MKNPEKQYYKRSERYKRLLEKQSKTANRISNLRLVVFVTGIAPVVWLYWLKSYFVMVAVFLAAASLFIYLVKIHHKVLENKKYSSILIEINNNSLKRLKGDWKDFKEDGYMFKDESHSYTGDLDIYGRASLFQMISVTATYKGKQKLKDILSNPDKDIVRIHKRQEAVNELAFRLSWRQRFFAEGSIIPGGSMNPEHLFKWAEDRKDFYLKGWVRALLRIIPSITLAVLILSISTGIISIYIPGLMLIAHFAALKAGSGERSRELNSVREYRDNIKVYERLLRMVERKSFESSHINEIREQLTNNGILASKQIRKLSKLVDSISNRYNAFYFVFNLFTLWDHQCMAALEHWKHNSGRFMEQWLDAIGGMEALSSLAIMRHDNSDWAMPEITDHPLSFKAENMGHPLLGEKCVKNDLVLDPGTKVLLITGSNMSGKSTFLRTAGINLVLAYAGAPVCARTFRCSVMDIYTCMRVSDNLEKNISSFYAELLRIKMIVKAAEEKRHIFFLLDEIFKGTNSIDRHTGAKVLVKKLSSLNTMGLVSTHDLELGELEGESTAIRNYHFSEHYSNNEICFDYRLHQGISKTRNAIYLMKMAGIEFEET